MSYSMHDHYEDHPDYSEPTTGEPGYRPSPDEYAQDPSGAIPRTVGEWRIARDYRPTPDIDSADNPF